MEIIHKLYAILNLIKGFETGYTSGNDSAFVMDYKGERYKVSLEKIEEPSETMFEDIKRYL